MVDTHPWKSLIELVDVLATTGGSELALTGGDGQVIKADHLSWHQLDTPVQWNIIKVFSVFTSLLVVDAWLCIKNGLDLNCSRAEKIDVGL